MECGIVDQKDEPGHYEASTNDYFERGWASTQALILELKKEVENSGAELVMVIVPAFQQFAPGTATPAWNDTKGIDRLERLCADYGLQCLDLFPTFRSLVKLGRNESLFYPRDGHPTAEGHLRIAEALYDYLSTRLP